MHITLYRKYRPKNFEEAASISTISKNVPLFIAKQFSHLLHGSSVIPFSRQFTPLAISLANVVFPTPLGPVNR